MARTKTALLHRIIDNTIRHFLSSIFFVTLLIVTSTAYAQVPLPNPIPLQQPEGLGQTDQVEPIPTPPIPDSSPATDGNDGVIDDSNPPAESMLAPPATTTGRPVLGTPPNIVIQTDPLGLAPFFENDVVQDDVVFRNGQTTYVTAREKTGYGLLPSDGSIAFYNAQLLTAVTPINGFNEQVVSDPRGRLLGNGYYFTSVMTNYPQLTITGVLTDAGLLLSPSYQHCLVYSVDAIPLEGIHPCAFRNSLALIGLDEDAVEQQVFENSYERVAQGIIEGARDQSLEKTSASQAEQNQTLQQVLIGAGRAQIGDLLVRNLRLRSRYDRADIDGLVSWGTATDVEGPDQPRPDFGSITPGTIAIDTHLPNLVDNLAQPFLDQSEIADLENIAVTLPSGGSTPAPDGDIGTGDEIDNESSSTSEPGTIQTSLPLDEYLDQLAEGRNVVRLGVPQSAPSLVVDDQGRLVLTVRDLQIVAPVPDAARQLIGQEARALQIRSDQTTIVLSLAVTATPDKPGQLDVRAKVNSIDFGETGQVAQILDAESDPVELNVFQRALVLAGAVAAFQQIPLEQAIDLPSDLPVELVALSEPDPSGWIRATVRGIRN